MQIQNTAAFSFPRTGRWSITAAALACVLAACGGSGGSAGGAASVAAAPGTLKLALTDAPACGFDHVYVTVEKIRIHPDGAADDAAAGWREIALSPARRIDLLTLGNGALAELGATPLAAGRYAQMRLVVADGASDTLPNAVVPTGGAETALAIPSGLRSGIKVQGEFEITAGQTADLVLDFDACKSVRSAGTAGSYQLKPVITMLPRAAGAIQGVLAPALATAGTTVAAQQDGVTVRSTSPDSQGRFSIPFLRPGSYNLVVASDGHATGVITGVPVGSAATAVNTSASAISLPESAAARVSGALSAGKESAPAQAAAFTEAHVRALQSIGDAGVVEVRSRPVDAVLGSYSLSLPKEAPVTSPFSASTAPSFKPADQEAGNYSIEVVLDEGASYEPVE